MKKKYFTTKRISSIAILSAIAGLLMLIDFPISFIAPTFYKMDISDLPCLIGSFALGPIAGAIIETLKILIKLVLKPTSTAFVGEIAAFIFSSAYCVSGALIYQKNKTKKNAIKAIIIASILMIVVSIAANYFFIIPAYVSLYKMPLEAIISMGTAIFPFINNKFSFVISCVLIFNFIKVLLVDVIVLVLYKHVSPIIKRFSL